MLGFVPQRPHRSTGGLGVPTKWGWGETQSSCSSWAKTTGAISCKDAARTTEETSLRVHTSPGGLGKPPYFLWIHRNALSP
uniref:Uncharacterized protein n=1 Tax=Tolypothrix bouteillei VB521301 TaxID=1479485 RepID=A0A0C1NFP8_9CYAN